MGSRTTYRILITVLLSGILTVLYSRDNNLPEKSCAAFEKIDSLNNLCKQWYSKDFQKAFAFGKLALQRAEDKNYQKGTADAFNNIAIIYYYQGAYDSMLFHLQKSLQIRKAINDRKGIADVYSNYAIVYNIRCEYEKAIQFNIRALKIRESIEDTAGMAKSLNNIGMTYYTYGDMQTALHYYRKAYQIKMTFDDDKSLASTLNNLGLMYFDLACTVDDRINKRYYLDSALFFAKKAHYMRMKLGDNAGMAQSLINIANIFGEQENFSMAVIYYQKAVEKQELLGDVSGKALSYHNIGIMHLRQGSYPAALNHLNRSLQLANSIHHTDITKDNYRVMAQCYAGLRRYDMAYKYQNKYHEIKDSLENAQVKKQIAEMQFKYNESKKEVELLKKTEEINRLEIHKSRIRTYFLIVIALLLFITGFFFFRAYLIKRKSNRLLNKQKQEIDSKNKEISLKNRDLTDSISYASRIQRVVLPSYKFLDKFSDSFVINRPKDLISGDFLWYSPNGTGFYIAVVDCTGHGVPGAFMSIVGNNLLNKTVSHKSFKKPSEILHSLDSGIKTMLNKHQNTTESFGMDISLCYFNPAQQEMIFAGVHHTAIVMNNGDYNEFNGNQHFFGKCIYEINPKFTDHYIKIQKDSKIYLFTDGYPDQYGGPENKKFLMKNFRALLREISHYPMSEQKAILELTLEEWMNGKNQIDDILVTGIRV